MRTPLDKAASLGQFQGVRGEAAVGFSLLNLVNSRTWQLSHLGNSGNIDSLVYAPGAEPVRSNGGALVPGFEVAAE